MWTDSNRDAWLCKSNFSLIFKVRNIQACVGCKDAEGNSRRRCHQVKNGG